MLKIYGADLSSPANKIRMTANALDIDYEYIRVNMRGKENRTMDYLKMHPAGKVPVIDDDGFILFESNAIIKYLAEKDIYPISLYPSGLHQRAVVDQWMDFTTIHVGAAIGRVLFNRVFAPYARVPVDERSMSDGLRFLDRFLPVIDRQLSKNGYLSGDEFSLADISLLATLDPVEAADIDISTYGDIVKWREKLTRKDFYTRCHKSYCDALKRMMAGIS